MDAGDRHRRRRQQQRGILQPRQQPALEPGSTPSRRTSPPPQGSAAAQLRADLTGRWTLPADLKAAGFDISDSLLVDKPLHVCHQRLAVDSLKAVMSLVGATHVVTSDPLDPIPAELRWGPAPGDFWKQSSVPGDYAKLTGFHLADTEHPLPLVALPHSLARTKERVSFELSNNTSAAGVVVLATIPRSSFDEVSDFGSLVQAAPSLLSGWGAGIVVSKAVGFAAPPNLAVLPHGNMKLPPLTWETAPLPFSRVLLALKVTRASDADCAPTYIKEGSQQTMKQLRADICIFAYLHIYFFAFFCIFYFLGFC